MTTDFMNNLVNKIKTLDLKIKEDNIGEIIEVGDGVGIATGLKNVSMGEILGLKNNIYALALNLKEDTVGFIIFGAFESIKRGDVIFSTGEILKVGAGYDLIGRVVSPLGLAVDGKGDIKAEKEMLIEKTAPGVIFRKSVDTPLQTGIKAIDSLIPIGRGQRELIIGDRGTGKTAIAVDTILNQKEENKKGKKVICIYCAIGQKQSKIAQLAAKFEAEGASEYTVVVAASSADSASLQYIAPYAATAMAEFFLEKGEDVLIVYDDLSKHAWSYRQISLLLKRPSGREAYPGDIFYLHSRLLERSVKLDEKYGGGSITALPIIETLAGDYSAFIPTNVISITDGQIYLEADLFNAGVRPAVNIGLSVSRVGGAAQIKAVKQVAGDLKLSLAQFRELAAFAQFGSDLDKATSQKLTRGEKITEVMKQPQFKPYHISEQILAIWVATKGYLDNVEKQNIVRFEKEFLKFIHEKHDDILKTIEKDKKISEELFGKMEGAVEEFKIQFEKEA
jgi:F-type H+/Na+-transporting ATPase subunit alpha